MPVSRLLKYVQISCFFEIVATMLKMKFGTTEKKSDIPKFRYRYLYPEYNHCEIFTQKIAANSPLTEDSKISDIALVHAVKDGAAGNIKLRVKPRISKFNQTTSKSKKISTKTKSVKYRRVKPNLVRKYVSNLPHIQIILT